MHQISTMADELNRRLAHLYRQYATFAPVETSNGDVRSAATGGLLPSAYFRIRAHVVAEFAGPDEAARDA